MIGSLRNGSSTRISLRGLREQLFQRHSARLLVEERLVRRVLQQAAHEVRHAGDEVADRAVGADAQPLGGDRVLERVAEAAQQGLRVRTYCPVGDLVAGMAYLVRRLLENTSNESFLADQAKGVPLEQLLAPPAVTAGR